MVKNKKLNYVVFWTLNNGNQLDEAWQRVWIKTKLNLKDWIKMVKI